VFWSRNLYKNAYASYASYTTVLIIQGRFTILLSFWFTVHKTWQRPEYNDIS